MGPVHNVIPIIHIEQDKQEPLGREAPPPAHIVFEGEDFFIIEKIVRQERSVAGTLTTSSGGENMRY